MLKFLKTSSANPKSLKLLKIDPVAKKLVLEKDALEIIRNIDGNVCVCSIVGPYKSGKSFLLTHILNVYQKLSGMECLYNTFEVGHYYAPATRDIWMNRKIPKISLDNEEVNFIFLDTQGIDGHETNEIDEMIIRFIIMISSVVMYNTKEELARSNLLMMTRISENLKSRSNYDDDENSRASKEDQPNFILIRRDFKPKKHDLLDETDLKISLADTFKSAECAYLASPVNRGQVESIHEINKLGLSDLKKNFISNFDELTSKLKELSSVKSINRHKMNGFRLVEYLNSIVNIINDKNYDGIIYIHDVVLQVVKTEANHILNETKSRYETKMKGLLEKDSDEPTDWNDYGDFHKKVSQECLIELYKRLGSFKDKIIEKYIRKFDEFVKEISVELYSINRKKIYKYYKTLATNEFKKFIEEKFNNDEELTEDDSDEDSAEIYANAFKFDFKVRFETVKFHEELSETFWLELFEEIKIIDLLKKQREIKAEKERQERLQRRQSSSRRSTPEILYYQLFRSSSKAASRSNSISVSTPGSSLISNLLSRRSFSISNGVNEEDEAENDSNENDDYVNNTDLLKPGTNRTERIKKFLFFQN